MWTPIGPGGVGREKGRNSKAKSPVGGEVRSVSREICSPMGYGLWSLHPRSRQCTGSPESGSIGKVLVAFSPSA